MTCKERERDEKEYIREEMIWKRDAILSANNMNHKSLYIVTLICLNTLCEKNERKDMR